MLNNEEQRNRLIRQIEEQETRDAILGFSIVGAIGFFFFLIIGIMRFQIFKQEKNPYKRSIRDTSLVNWKAMGCMSIVFFPIAVVYFVVMWFLKRKYIYEQLCCKRCGSYSVKKPTSKRMRVATKYQKGLVRYFFPCKKCGYIHTEDEYIKYVAPAAYSSSGSGYSGSSSSSSGGSWGGGSSGGGGAGTSF